MLECFKSHHKNHVCQLACWFEEWNALYHWIESLLLPQSFFLKHRVYVSILPLSCVKQVHISSTAFNYLALQIHLLWFSYCHFGCLCNSCHLHSSVVLLVHYLYSFDKKNKYISGQLMDGLFNSWYLKVWERCSPGKVTFFLKRRVMSLIFCNQGSLRRRHVICLLFFATKTYRYFHHSGLLIWSVECILVFESLILPLSFFWNAECMSKYCHCLVLIPICSIWLSF